MPESLRVIIDIVMLTVMSIGILSWVAITIYAVKTVRRARPGVAIWGRPTRWNPFNLLLLPGLLTDDGRSCRKKCFLAIAIFFGAVGAGAVMGSIVHAIYGQEWKLGVTQISDVGRTFVNPVGSSG